MRASRMSSAVAAFAITTVSVGLAGAGCAAVTEATAPTPAEEVWPAADIGLEFLPVDGPHERLEGYCKELTRRKDVRARCVGEAVRALDEPDPPYEVIEVIRVRHLRSGVEYCEIAARLADGWYVTNKLFICAEDGSKMRAEVLSLELVAQKKTAPIIRVEVRTEDEADGAVLETEDLALCGVGELGEVSCTPAFSRFEHVIHPDGNQESRTLSVTLSRFGILKVRGDGFVDGEVIDLTGAYRLELP